MTKLTKFIGIDISKETVDIAIIDAEIIDFKIISQQLKNSKTGAKMLASIIKKRKWNLSDTLVCMEFTGVYSKSFARHLLNLEFNVWLEMPFRIKNSTGLVRGKSDKMDAINIAQYCMRYKENRRMYVEEDHLFEHLQTLIGYRESLITKRIALNKNYNELVKMGLKEEANVSSPKTSTV